MRYSTNILTALVVLSSAAAAHAQGYNSFYTPAQNNYGITRTNFQFSQPIRLNQPCLNGNCATTIPRQAPYTTPYTSQANYGLSPACVNGRCNHPQHQIAPNCINGQCNDPRQPLNQNCLNGRCQHPQHQVRFGNSAYCPNGNCGLNCCPNGKCLTGQCLTGQCTTGQYPTYRPVNGAIGSSTIPFNSTYRNNNSVTTIPNYKTQSIRPVSNNPYYN